MLLRTLHLDRTAEGFAYKGSLREILSLSSAASAVVALSCNSHGRRDTVNGQRKGIRDQRSHCGDAVASSQIRWVTK